MNKHYETEEKKKLNKKRSPRQKLTTEISDVNRQRLKLGAKGFLTIVDLRTYCGGVSYGRAQKIYNEIKEEIECAGCRVCPLGVPTSEVNKYLNISQAQIEKYAEMGL